MLARADEAANAAKPALWAEHRRKYGDPLDRLRADVESGAIVPEKEETDAGTVYRMNRRPQLTPTSGWGPIFETAHKIIDAEGEIHQPVPPKRVPYPPTPTLCEMCGTQPAAYPRERQNRLFILKAPRWGLGGRRLLRDAQGHLEALQICCVGPFAFVVPGPRWEEAYHTYSPLLIRRIPLGPLFRIRPWLCVTCRLSRQKAVSARTHARWTVKRAIGRELVALGRWLNG